MIQPAPTMNPIEQYLGCIECLPCSVAAWCDMPVYHPAPECSEELLLGSDFWRTPEVRAEPRVWDDDELRVIPDELLHKLPPDILQRRDEAQKKYVQWAKDQGWTWDASGCIGFGIFADKGFAAEFAEKWKEYNATKTTGTA